MARTVTWVQYEDEVWGGLPGLTAQRLSVRNLNAQQGCHLRQVTRQSTLSLKDSAVPAEFVLEFIRAGLKEQVKCHQV